jgi:hypothetical protein
MQRGHRRWGAEGSFPNAEPPVTMLLVSQTSSGERHGEESKKQTGRGRKQDRARVAGEQKYEVQYEAKKTRRSAGAP